MFDDHVDLVLDRIKPGNLVLDVGGWARCFNRATHVIDFYPHATRGLHYLNEMNLGPQGGDVEHFSADTWVEWELCNHKPWPFADKQFDFCTCSHTLEDIRDPLWVCAEMIRVARAGYIEIPSRLFESCRGREAGVPVGLSHHRWLIEVAGSEIVFYPKSPLIYGDPRCSLPPSVWKSIPEREFITHLFWERDFSYGEGPLDLTALRAFAARYLPDEAREPLDSTPSHEVARLEAEVAVLKSELMRAEESSRAVRAEAERLQVRLQALAGLGPRSMAIAGRIGALAERHPAAAHAFAKITRMQAG